MRIYITLLITVVTLLSACSKSKDCDYIKATVIRYDCDRAVLQLDESHPIGENDWYDSESGQRFDNVVSCLNICSIRELTKARTNAVIYVKVARTDRINGEVCLVCVGIPLAAPRVVVKTTALSDSPCR